MPGAFMRLSYTALEPVRRKTTGFPATTPRLYSKSSSLNARSSGFPLWSGSRQSWKLSYCQTSPGFEASGLEFNFSLYTVTAV